MSLVGAMRPMTQGGDENSSLPRGEGIYQPQARRNGAIA